MSLRFLTRRLRANPAYKLQPSCRAVRWSMGFASSTATDDSRNEHVPPDDEGLIVNNVMTGMLDSGVTGKAFTSAVLADDNSLRVLKDSVFLNPAFSAAKTGMTHVEVDQDHIRLEFLDTCEHYRAFAQLFLESKYGVLDASMLDDCFIPVKVQNKVNVGAGATVFLSRVKVAAKLKTVAALTNGEHVDQGRTRDEELEPLAE